jgi:hypothetical protein
MLEVKAVYDGVNFKPIQPITVKGQYSVVITFIEQIAQEEPDSTAYLLDPDTSKTPTLGRLNGTISIPHDFDEPLDEMKEYMF